MTYRVIAPLSLCLCLSHIVAFTVSSWTAVVVQIDVITHSCEALGHVLLYGMHMSGMRIHIICGRHTYAQVPSVSQLSVFHINKTTADEQGRDGIRQKTKDTSTHDNTGVKGCLVQLCRLDTPPKVTQLGAGVDSGCDEWRSCIDSGGVLRALRVCRSQ